jgi:plasmid stabilization system protein ParE
MPFRCSLAFENNFFNEEIRQLIYGKGRNSYRIIFTIVDNSVQILFVRHAAQEPIIDEFNEE